MSFEKLLETAKPVVFDTGWEETPYAGIGTCFIVLYKQDTFAITAKHVIDDCSGESLVIFPNKETELSIPFNTYLQVTDSDGNDGDYADIAIFKVDYKALELEGSSVIRTIDLNKYDSSWNKRKSESELFFFGYPSEHRKIDYEQYLISSDQHLLVAKYVGKSVSQFCYEIEIKDLKNISNLDGFSGSPVFCISTKKADQPFMTWCGMLIRGTSESKRAYFIDGGIIIQILEKGGVMPNMALNKGIFFKG